ncbi:MAG: hypothetical protein H0X12_03950 [Nocardioides sp.]|nr:hypothetical protein [Nocardioides sp.]
MRVVGRFAATAVVACVASLTLGSPASAADARVVPGSTQLDDQTFLTYVPCAGFFASGTTVPGLRINRGHDGAPLGRRSFGLAMAGAGTAAGVVHQTTSMDLLGDVSMAVNPDGATSGVSYVWYISPDLPAGQAWLGRADLAAAPGWQRVDVSAASFTWQAHDLATRQPLGDSSGALLRDFVAAHGDGPGYVVSGFGCDGTSFNIDNLTYGQSTYDLEGFTATTSIAAEAATPGRPVTLRGWSERDSSRRLGDPLILEQRVAGTADWKPVGGPTFSDPDAIVRATVDPDVATYYRWRMADSEYADANVSDGVLVEPAPQPGPGSDEATDPTKQPEPTKQPDRSKADRVKQPSPTSQPTPTPAPSPTPIPALSPLPTPEPPATPENAPALLPTEPPPSQTP